MAARNAPVEAPVGDDVLVGRCRRGDQRAFHALYERHYDYVARIVVRLLGDRDDLEDIMQETFRQAFGSIDRLRSPDKVRYWLTAIAVRSTKRHLVSRRKNRRTDRQWTAEAPEVETPPTDLRLVEVYEALDRISAKLRVPLMLHRVEGLTLDQVAAICEVSTSTVKRRVAAAEKRLKRLLHVD